MEGNCLRMVYHIDKQGFIINSTVRELNQKDNKLADKIDDNIVTTPLPQPNYYKPKWTGVAWTEGETTEEKTMRETLYLLEILTPKISELEDAKIEIKTIQLLLELGVLS